MKLRKKASTILAKPETTLQKLQSFASWQCFKPKPPAKPGITPQLGCDRIALKTKWNSSTCMKFKRIKKAQQLECEQAEKNAAISFVLNNNKTI